MLDDRERGLLAEIERGLLLDAPELTRAFEVFASGPVWCDPVWCDEVSLETVPVARSTPVVRARRRRRDRAGTAVAGLVLGTVLLAGPRALTGSEVARRAAARPPRVRPRTVSP